MNRRMDWVMVAHVLKIVALVVGVSFMLLMLYDSITIPETVDRKLVLKHALGAALSLALATYLILNPPE